MFASSHLFSLGPPHTSPADPVVPTESVPPETPDMCDPTLSFDAVSTLRGEILFFKDRSDRKILFPYLFFCSTMLRNESVQKFDRGFLIFKTKTILLN